MAIASLIGIIIYRLIITIIFLQSENHVVSSAAGILTTLTSSCINLVCIMVLKLVSWKYFLRTLEGGVTKYHVVSIGRQVNALFTSCKFIHRCTTKWQKSWQTARTTALSQSTTGASLWNSTSSSSSISTRQFSTSPSSKETLLMCPVIRSQFFSLLV